MLSGSLRYEKYIFTDINMIQSQEDILPGGERGLTEHEMGDRR